VAITVRVVFTCDACGEVVDMGVHPASDLERMGLPVKDGASWFRAPWDRERVFCPGHRLVVMDREPKGHHAQADVVEEAPVA
jgi:hypothetical protein